MHVAFFSDLCNVDYDDEHRLHHIGRAVNEMVHRWEHGESRNN